MVTDRRIPSRALLLVPGGFALLAGLDAALALLGLPAPITTTRLAEVHGVLLVLGFVDPVLAERAVARGDGGPTCPGILGAGAVLRSNRTPTLAVRCCSPGLAPARSPNRWKYRKRAMPSATSCGVRKGIPRCCYGWAGHQTARPPCRRRRDARSPTSCSGHAKPSNGPVTAEHLNQLARAGGIARRGDAAEHGHAAPPATARAADSR